MTDEHVYVVEQNLGFVDRCIRFIIGIVLIGAPTYLMFTTSQPAEVWYNWSMLISIYPFLTAITGRDVVYDLFHVKSCDLSSRNKCGSFPFEWDAFLGHNPIPEDDTEHTLHHSKHMVKHV